jgi:hypothetical protein
MDVIPESHIDLLERPLFAHFATRREDGWPHTRTGTSRFAGR